LFAVDWVAIHDDELNAVEQADAFEFPPCGLAAIGAFGQRYAIDLVKKPPCVLERIGSSLALSRD
jgi:hypothetical protein